MKKKNIIYILSILAITLASLLIGKSITGSKSDSIVSYKQIANDNVFVSFDENEQQSSIYFNTDNKITFKDLENEADVVVKVKADDDRLCYLQAVKTQVTVLEVLKGDEIESNEKIFIYEPIVYNTGHSIESIGGYNFMNPDDEYIIFLKHLQIPKGYKYKDDEEITYLPTTLMYSKYNAMNKMQDKPINQKKLDTGEVMQMDVKNNEIITSNKKSINHFYSLKNKVIEWSNYNRNKR